MDLDSVAQELYGLPPSEFVPTRNARAKEARAGGDRELAAEIQGLAKPTIAAWLVNQLGRESGAELDPLIDLGRQLRDASAKLDGETMRTLGRERNQLISDLLAQARRVGDAHGHRVSDDVADEVRQTLEASLSDSEIADAVAAGRLTRSVEYAGFGEIVGLGGPTGVVGKPARRSTPDRPARSKPPAKRAAKPAEPPSRPTDLADRRRQRAEREAAEAAKRLEAARSARDEAAREQAGTTAEVERAEAEMERLRAELRETERAAKAARHADRSARHALAKTERELSGVERAHERATASLADLDD